MNDNLFLEDPDLIKVADAYEIEIPAEKVEQEVHIMQLELKHRVQYGIMQGMVDTLTAHEELEEQMREIPARAYRMVKTEQVLDDLISKWEIMPSREELKAEAERISKDSNLPEHLTEKFWGEDYQLLVKDLQIRKVMEMIKNGMISPGK